MMQATIPTQKFSFFFRMLILPGIFLISCITAESPVMSQSSVVVSKKLDLQIAIAKALLPIDKSKISRGSLIKQAESVDILSCPDCNLGDYSFWNEKMSKTIVLQIPHRYSDLHTYEIGKSICSIIQFKSCGFNTSHRKIMDFAHDEESPFQDMTKMMLEFDPNSLIVQIHGFEHQKRVTSNSNEIEMILSGGGKSSAPWLNYVLSTLKLDQDRHIRIYGRDIDELGGTSNMQNQLIKSEGKGRFLHIELSYEYRTLLLKDKNELKKLRKIILAAANTTEEQASLIKRKKL